MNEKPNDGWRAAVHIIKSLRAAGHTALLAGGCVRDRLLGLEPKDYDVATDAPPTRVRKLFPRARKVGAQFGVMLVRKFGVNVEVATFRTDGCYGDGRHPDDVSFGTQFEDAQRRDFTINGLFHDPIDDRLIDHVGGQADLADRVIRTIGDADRRFSEDHLRMLRAVRFAARLGFQIDPLTLEAIQRCAESLRRISPERIWMELAMILGAASRLRGWSLLMSTGLRSHLAKHWPPHEAHDASATQRLKALPPVPVKPALALASVLCDWAIPVVADICRDLRLGNKLAKAVCWQVRSLPDLRDSGPMDLADLKQLMASEHWPLLLELVRIDGVASNRDEKPYEKIKRRAENIAPDDVAPPPLLTGDDLQAMGMTPGPRMGEILKSVYRAQLNETIRLREEAIALVRQMQG